MPHSSRAAICSLCSLLVLGRHGWRLHTAEIEDSFLIKQHAAYAVLLGAGFPAIHNTQSKRIWRALQRYARHTCGKPVGSVERARAYLFWWGHRYCVVGSA